MTHSRSILLFYCSYLLAAFFSTQAPAYADRAPLAIDHFFPAPGSGKLLTTELGSVGSSSLLSPAEIKAHPFRIELVPQLFFHYAYRPLVYDAGDGSDRTNLVSHRLTVDFSLSLAIGQRFQFALLLPLTVYQQGDAVVGLSPQRSPDLPYPLAFGGVEDLHILLKGVIYNSHLAGSRGPLQGGLAIIGDLTVPIGNTDAFLGTPLPTFGLLVAGHLKWDRLTVALNFGGLLARPEHLQDQLGATIDPTTGYGLIYRTGIQVDLYQRHQLTLAALAEVFGITHLPFVDLRQSPAEVSLALKLAYNEWTFFVGGGPGLNKGYGVPDGRVFAGVSFAWNQPLKKMPEKVPFPELQPPKKEPPPEEYLGSPYCDCEDEYPLKGRAAINSSHRVVGEASMLEHAIEALNSHTEYTAIEVEVHQGPYGDPAQRLANSQKAAEGIRDYFIQHGISATRLSAKGYGDLCEIWTPQIHWQDRYLFLRVLEKNGHPIHNPKCTEGRKTSVQQMDIQGRMFPARRLKQSKVQSSSSEDDF